jgi:HlyD family secretion protein
MKKRGVRILATLVVLAIVVVALRFTVFRTEAVPVTVFRVARGVVEETVTNSKAGTVKSRKRAKLSPEVGGRVAELNVREGDRVEQGQVLLRIADADYRARVGLQERARASAHAAQREACLTAEQAERDYERYKRLAEDEIVSRELLDQQESRRNVTAAGCEAARAAEQEAASALELARVELTKTVLRAPFDAVVAEVETEVGEWVTPSPPALPVPSVLELIQDAATYISAPLDEVDLAKLRVGQEVRATLDAYRGQAFEGTVVRIAPYVLDVEEHSRTFEIEVELADRDFAAELRPGTSADVEVILSAKRDVLRVPSYALIEGGRVFIVEDGEIVAREVATGIRNWDFTEITDGLEAGEQIVVSVDRVEVKEGAQVRVTDETLK